MVDCCYKEGKKRFRISLINTSFLFLLNDIIEFVLIDPQISAPRSVPSMLGESCIKKQMT